MSSLVKTLRRWYWTVRGDRNSRVPISGLDRPSAASRAIWASCAVSSTVGGDPAGRMPPSRSPPAAGRRCAAALGTAPRCQAPSRCRRPGRFRQPAQGIARQPAVPGAYGGLDQLRQRPYRKNIELPVLASLPGRRQRVGVTAKTIRSIPPAAARPAARTRPPAPPASPHAQLQQRQRIPARLRDNLLPDPRIGLRQPADRQLGEPRQLAVRHRKDHGHAPVRLHRRAGPR
jgi:hypothetical protein